MESWVYALPVRLLVLAILIGWTFLLGKRAVFRETHPRFSGQTAVGISLGLFVLIRLLYLPDREQNVDTGTWIATAITVGKASDPLYTLLTSSDGRPLGVLPLALLEMAGIPLEYASIDLLGVLIWCLTLWLFRRLIIRFLPEETATCLIWLPILLLSTIWYHDFASFNTEITGNLWLMLGIFGLERLSSKSGKMALFLGFWLGCLPFVKFQTVPMGLVFGLFAVWKLYRIGRIGALAGLLGGAVVPVLLLTVYFASRNDLESFWGDYFSNYFVYSYTTEYSSLSGWERFSPVRIGRYLFHSYKVAGFWLALFLAMLFGSGRLFRLPLKTGQRERFWLAVSWWTASLYAVLQAGNNYPHYQLFLFFPSLFLLAVLLEINVLSTTRRMLFLSLGLALAQAAVNTVYRAPLPVHPGEPVFRQLTSEIQNRTQPNESVVVWGYLDRLHVYARRPMGYRSSNTFWVYSPTSTQPYRIRQFLGDLQQNRPRLFVDALSHRLAPFSDQAYRFERIPAINAYIREHYRLIKTVEDVRIFERRE
ncbi:hypothetical protein ACO2Q8_04540 [Larkinella sp. VNQ87]|uniref:hypothetical protein n=1 Tax=Larkinella sp. VNQ87 TaxID=3400921 RepID=UPI003C07A836